MVEAAGVEPFMPMKTRKLCVFERLKRPKGPECQIDCTFTVRLHFKAPSPSNATTRPVSAASDQPLKVWVTAIEFATPRRTRIAERFAVKNKSVVESVATSLRRCPVGWRAEDVARCSSRALQRGFASGPGIAEPVFCPLPASPSRRNLPRVPVAPTSVKPISSQEKRGRPAVCVNRKTVCAGKYQKAFTAVKNSCSSMYPMPHQ